MTNAITPAEAADRIDDIAADVAARLRELSVGLRAADGTVSAVHSEPERGRWRLEEQLSRAVDYRWMDGVVDLFETFDIYSHPDTSRRFAIGRVAPREISGRGVRAYSVPFSMVGGEIEYPHGTFYDTDDHAETGDLACIIRGAGESRR